MGSWQMIVWCVLLEGAFLVIVTHCCGTPEEPTLSLAP